MKGKRIAGIIILIIGIALLVLGFYVKSRVSSAEKTIGAAQGFVPFCPANKVIENMTQEKIEQYRKLYKWSFGGGILLAIVGGGMIATSRKR